MLPEVCLTMDISVGSPNFMYVYYGLIETPEVASRTFPTATFFFRVLLDSSWVKILTQYLFHTVHGKRPGVTMGSLVIGHALLLFFFKKKIKKFCYFSFGEGMIH